jgi:predicted transcriptional regulator
VFRTWLITASGAALHLTLPAAESLASSITSSTPSRTDPQLEESHALIHAVPVCRSITPDCVTCLEDGRNFRSLERYLRTKDDLTAPYRANGDYRKTIRLSRQLRYGTVPSRKEHGMGVDAAYSASYASDS